MLRAGDVRVPDRDIRRSGYSSGRAQSESAARFLLEPGVHGRRGHRSSQLNLRIQFHGGIYRAKTHCGSERASYWPSPSFGFSLPPSRPVLASGVQPSPTGSQSSSSFTVKMITSCSVPESRSFTHGPTYPSSFPCSSRDRSSSMLLHGSTTAFSVGLCLSVRLL